MKVGELCVAPLEAVEEVRQLRIAHPAELTDGGLVALEEVLVRLPCLRTQDLGQVASPASASRAAGGLNEQRPEEVRERLLPLPPEWAGQDSNTPAN